MFQKYRNFFLEILTKIFKLIEEIKLDVAEARKEHEEMKVQLCCLLTANSTGPFNKFSKILPISSMEKFDEIDSCLETSENDYASLVSV